MKYVLTFLAFTIFVWPMAVKADPIQDVISGQIEAFQADDFDKAFTYASPLIQGIFGNADRFGMMVRNGYPMVWRPADVAFVGQEIRGGLIYQKVRIRDAKGISHVLEYEMIRGPEGWVINGVAFVEAPGLAA